VAPHEDRVDSQSYYSESNDDDREELKEAYKVLYVKYLKLRETPIARVGTKQPED
jgi:hypothetical protein